MPPCKLSGSAGMMLPSGRVVRQGTVAPHPDRPFNKFRRCDVAVLHLSVLLQCNSTGLVVTEETGQSPVRPCEWLVQYNITSSVSSAVQVEVSCTDDVTCNIRDAPQGGE